MPPFQMTLMLEAILLGIFDLDQSLTILAEWQIGVNSELQRRVRSTSGVRGGAEAAPRMATYGPGFSEPRKFLSQSATALQAHVRSIAEQCCHVEALGKTSKQRLKKRLI
jgi:hypothetical protein